jgi:hypothetical protein
VLGPLLRYAGTTTATIWVETDAATVVEVLGPRTATFQIFGPIQLPSQSRRNSATRTAKTVDQNERELAYPGSLRQGGVSSGVALVTSAGRWF